jgi:hypothetical protein
MTTPLANVFAGSSEASSVSQALVLNKPTVAVPNNSSKSDRFWSSSRQPASSLDQEVLEMNFSTASLTNRISFEAAKFPQTIRVQYTKDSGNTWLPAIDKVTGQPIVLELLRAYPAILPSPNAVNGHSHPQHDYDGHWERIQLQIVADDMQKIRFVIQRNPNGQPPIDVTGAPVPYSVALQNIYIGYEIGSHSDIPRSILEDGSQGTEKVFANSTDIFGSNLGFSKKTQFANNLLFNSDASAPLIWKSEPQPFPRAVVNFYADLRDRNGAAQVIDRIFIDPLYDGSHISLYYSNDSTGGNFVSSRKALTNSQAAFSNANIVNNALSLGNYGDSSFAQVNNQYLSFDPSQAWWLGAQFTLGFTQSADGNDHSLFGCGTFQVGFNSTGVYIKTNANDTNLVPVTLDNVNPIQVIAAYHDNTLHLSVQQNGIIISQDIPATVALSTTIPAQLFIGTDVTTTKFLNSPITAFILKQERWTDDSFLQYPIVFSQIPRFDTSTDVARNNALLRFDSSQTSTNTSTGLIGGPAFNYESLNWTPIPREYEMHRGNMQLPPTKAKFWNLEITNLRPEMSEKFVPVERQVKVFPPEVLSQFDSPSADRASADDMATNVQSSLSNSMSYTDVPRYVGTGGTNSGISNTEVYVSDDYETTKRLRELGNQWKYRQWRADRQAPRFIKAGQHNYNTQTITQTSNVSYFTGLRQIQFSRTVQTSPQDHSFIEETFVDGAGINSGNWYTGPNGGLYSGKSVGGSYARTTSIIIPTQRAIRGLQFAAQQTDNKQLNTNGEFSDPSYTAAQVSNWIPQGDGKILGLTQAISGGDTALMVSRQTNTGFWGDIAVNYVTWGALALGKGYHSGTDIVTFPTTSSSSVLTYQGIQQSTIQVVSADGLITYALGTDYTISATNGSNPNSVTTIFIVGAGTIPLSTPITVIYSYADAAHPTCVKYSDLAAGAVAPSFTGGIQSSPLPLPAGGRIHAAARVTATKALSQPLWIQILDADTGGVLAEEQSNVGKNEVKEWYTSLDIKDFGGRVGITWGDLVGKKVWPSWSDNFTRVDSTSLGFFVSGQSWNTPFGGTGLQIVSNAAKAIAAGNRSEVDTGNPWGTLDVTLGNAITTGTHASAVPVIDLGGYLVMNDSTVESTNVSATLFTLSTAVGAGVRYRFKFMPTNAVPVGQQVGGADPVARPYSLLVFTRNNDTPSATETWVQTYSGTQSFSSLRALMGGTGQTFAYFNWAPGTAQVNVTNQQMILPIPTTSALQPTGFGGFFWDQTPTRRWEFMGQCTYGTNLNAITVAALNPTGSFVAVPTGLGAAAVGSGGSFAAATYYWKITAVNAAGETLASSEVNAVIVLNGSANLTWSAASGATGYNIYRGTATGVNFFVDSVGAVTSYTDLGNQNPTTTAPPKQNTTDGAGTMSVVDVNDQFGSMDFSVTQIASGLGAGIQAIAYLNWNPATNKIITLQADGTIYDQLNATTLKTSMFGSATAGPISVRYVSAQTLSAGFKTTWSVGGTATQAMIFLQSNAVVGVYSGIGIWDTTVRGIGGANNGTSAGTYTIIEGFSWNPDASLLATNTSNVLWSNVSYGGTRTYDQMSIATKASVQNISIRLIQKSPALDYWYTESAALFWDPVVWQFSCDGGLTFWNAGDIRNNPDGALLFPYKLTNYNNLQWRVTSYAGDVSVNNLTIRPWYQGMPKGIPPRPTQLPVGPNLVPSDHYGPIERDPKWMVWNKPIPRAWWFNFKKSISS